MSSGSQCLKTTLQWAWRPTNRTHTIPRSVQRTFTSSSPLKAADDTKTGTGRAPGRPLFPPRAPAQQKSESSRERTASLLEGITRRQTTSPPRSALSQNRFTEDLMDSAQQADNESGNRLVGKQNGLLFSGMQTGTYPSSATDDYRSLYNNASSRRLNPLDAPVRLDAFVGRGEPVTLAGGLSVALRKMEIKCAINKVKQDQIRQRFHERPGLKRKRLKSSRWRLRFKQGFTATVAKVQRMRKQGW